MITEFKLSNKIVIFNQFELTKAFENTRNTKIVTIRINFIYIWKLTPPPSPLLD